MRKQAVQLCGVWCGLLVCLAATVAISLSPALFKTGWNLSISLAKALLIAWFFMGLRRSGGRSRIAAGAVALWLLILFGAVAIDIVSRAPSGG